MGEKAFVYVVQQETLALRAAFARYLGHLVRSSLAAHRARVRGGSRGGGGVRAGGGGRGRGRSIDAEAGLHVQGDVLLGGAAVPLGHVGLDHSLAVAVPVALCVGREKRGRSGE